VAPAYPELNVSVRWRLGVYGWWWVWRPLAAVWVSVDLTRFPKMLAGLDSEALSRALAAVADEVETGHGSTHHVLPFPGNSFTEWVVVMPGGRAAAIAWAENVRARVEQHACVGPVSPIRVAIEAEERGFRRHGRRPLLLRAEIAAYDQLIDEYIDSPELVVQVTVARTLLDKARTLRFRGDEAIAVYDRLIERFGDARETPLREEVETAVHEKIVALSLVGRSEEQVTFIDRWIELLSDAPEPARRESVAAALYCKAIALGDLDRLNEAVAVYDQLIDRLDDLPEPVRRRDQAMTLFNKGTTLAKLGRSNEAIAVYDELIERFGDAPELPLQAQAARALHNKDVILSEL